jgi:hypothetical protein
MIFHQLNEIVTGDKTQTRRIVKPGEAYAYRYLGSKIEHINSFSAAYCPKMPTSMITKVFTPTGRVKWQVGKDYAVQPGRGEPGLYWLPSLRKWSKPEYYIKTDDFWRPLRIVIASIRIEHLLDINKNDVFEEGVDTHEEYRALFEKINGPGQWNNNPYVWVLDFKVKR